MRNFKFFTFVLIVVMMVMFGAVSAFADGEPTPTPTPKTTCTPPVLKKAVVRKPAPAKPAPTKPACDLCGALGENTKAVKDTAKAIREGNTQAHTDHQETVGLLNKLVTGVESLVTTVVNIPTALAGATGLAETNSWLKYIFWAMVLGFIVLIILLAMRFGQGATANGSLHRIDDGINGRDENNPGINQRLAEEHRLQQIHRERTEAYYANNPMGTPPPVTAIAPAEPPANDEPDDNRTS